MLTPPDPKFVVTRPAPDHLALMSSLGDSAIHSPAFELVAEPEPVLASLVTGLREFDKVVVTSPFAARLLAGIAEAVDLEDVQFFAPGRGTAAGLRAAGIAVRFPLSGGTSEHILDMAEFADVEKKRIAIVGAPGGRDLLARELARRGARVVPAHVYRRVGLPPSRMLIDALHRGDRLVTLISSLQTFGMIHDALPDELREAWTAARFVVSSERIERACREAGVRLIQRADGAADARMLSAAVDAGWQRAPAD